MTYRVDTHVKPLIWADCVVENFTRSKIEYLVKAKTQFKAKSIANNVEIIVPVPPDVDSPVFTALFMKKFSKSNLVTNIVRSFKAVKCNVGTVKYVPDTNCMVWCIKSFPGRKEF